MTSPAPHVEATSLAVGKNLVRIRNERGYSIRELSALMSGGDHPMGPAAISELERGVRRATVDDLTALAMTLGVSPVALLMPQTKQCATPLVELTGTEMSKPEDVLRWLLGIQGLPPGFEDTIRENFPPWAWGWRLDDSTTL